MKPTVQAKEWEKELKKITASIISPDGDGCTSSSIAGLQEYPKLVSFISSTLAEARKETIQEIVDHFKIISQKNTDFIYKTTDIKQWAEDALEYIGKLGKDTL